MDGPILCEAILMKIFTTGYFLLVLCKLGMNHFIFLIFAIQVMLCKLKGEKNDNSIEFIKYEVYFAAFLSIYQPVDIAFFMKSS